MTITKTENGNVTTIAVEGRLNTATANEFGNEVKKLLESVDNLVFDFEKLEYMASAGLRVLLSSAKVMKKQGTMKIINVTEPVMDVFTFTGMADVMDIEAMSKSEGEINDTDAGKIAGGKLKYPPL